jgi:hypothetical protein
MNVVEQMSPAERAFIKTYVAALRRDYSLLYTVFALMDPGQLAVQDVATATRVAVELQHMHAEFESCLHNIASCQKFFRRGPSFTPTFEELADLFTLSFFKILTSVKKKHEAEKKIDVGWFSGKPEEWQTILKQIDKFHPVNESIQNDIPSSILGMFAKFFPQFKNVKYSFDTDGLKDATLPNTWPPFNFDKSNYKNKTQAYDAEPDDLDGDNPFWPLFQDYYEDEDDED